MSFSTAPVDRRGAQRSDEPMQNVAKGIRVLEVDAALEIRVIWQNNRTSNLSIGHNSTVFDLLQRLVPGRERRFIIEAFELVYGQDTRPASFLQCNDGHSLLISSVDRPFPVRRDRATADADNRLLRRANDLIKLHWNV